MNRYRDLTQNLVKNDNTCAIPRNVFVRSANANGDSFSRKGDNKIQSKCRLSMRLSRHCKTKKSFLQKNHG